MRHNFGFTLIELLVIFGVLVILTGTAIPAFQLFRRESDLNNISEEIINTLRLAQNKTLSSEGESQWGVYFNTSTNPHQYVLFKGSDYNSRATSSDEIHQLPKILEIYAVDLGGGNEAVFERVTGETSQFGSISLRLNIDFTKARTIYVESSGQVSLTGPTVPSNGRVEDSRHVHFNYSRLITTSTEKLILTFDTTFTEEIIIADYFKDGQIYWEGEVDVAGSIQKLKIHTHRFNNPDTQFCIHRDRRYNNKSLEIDIDGDSAPTPNLINYSADGLTTTKGNSIYATDPEWQ